MVFRIDTHFQSRFTRMSIGFATVGSVPRERATAAELSTVVPVKISLQENGSLFVERLNTTPTTQIGMGNYIATNKVEVRDRHKKVVFSATRDKRVKFSDPHSWTLQMGNTTEKINTTCSVGGVYIVGEDEVKSSYGSFSTTYGLDTTTTTFGS